MSNTLFVLLSLMITIGAIGSITAFWQLPNHNFILKGVSLVLFVLCLVSGLVLVFLLL